MKAATIHEIKQELATIKPAALADLCLRLAKFKKENKELLTYLLFEAHNEHLYQSQLKKVHAILDTLHEDLRYDYYKELELLK